MLSVDRSDPAYRAYAHHLYIDATGHFVAPLNSWEHAVVQAEVAREDVVGWLRNIERKPWALAMPYELGGEVRPMYPDFLVVRREGGGLVVDILEPHSPALADSYAKAKGLAQFAAKHAMQVWPHRADSIGWQRNQAAGFGRAGQPRQGAGGG
jgi:type III restriction enzyme